MSLSTFNNELTFDAKCIMRRKINKILPFFEYLRLRPERIIGIITVIISYYFTHKNCILNFGFLISKLVVLRNGHIGLNILIDTFALFINKQYKTCLFPLFLFFPAHICQHLW